MRKLIILLVFLGILYSCVNEYKIPLEVSNNYQEELVIEGRILSGEESVFYITRTLPLNSGLSVSYIMNADVYIIGQNGYRSEKAINIEDGKYIIDTGELDKNTQYAVEISAKGEIYQSKFQPLLSTPDIHEISYKEREDKSVSFHVTTYGNNVDSRFYMWTYEEDWEFRASIDPFGGKMPGFLHYDNQFYGDAKDGKNPYYYCWMHNNSYTLNIYSAADLSENTVKGHELFRIGVEDIRISYIYSVLLKQWSLTEEAYEYFRLMKLYTEDSDGLFTPMPTDVRGNVFCYSNPEKSVRGYVIASDVKTKRMFLYESDLVLNHSEYDNCHSTLPNTSNPNWVKEWLEKIKYNGALAVSPGENIDTESILYNKECIDCRKTQGATKKRPDFWPNNHE